MKIRELFDYIMLVKPHLFSDSIQLMWLNELEGRVQLDIYLLAPEEVKGYRLPEDENTELLVSLPHTGIYRYWMQAMVDLERGEYQKYQNTMEAFNAAWNEYACYFAETQGTEGDGVSHGFYLSAYGIAVKHGFTGTEEEWLESLHGEKGDPFTYEDFTQEQLADLRAGVVQETLDTANASAQAAEQSADEAAQAAAQAESAAQGAVQEVDAQMSGYVSAAQAAQAAAEKARDEAKEAVGGDFATKEYVDQKISDIQTPDVSGQIGAHNKDENAHKDIRQAVSAASSLAAGKQDKITGSAGQMIGFDESGNPVAQDMPESSSLGANTYTLTTSGWSNNGDGRFKQTISVPGVTTDITQVIWTDVALTGTDLDADAETLSAWGPDDGSGPSSQNVAQGSGTLTFYCTAVPTVNIPVYVGVS